MEVVETISKVLVVLVILVDLVDLIMTSIHLKFLNSSLQILVQMMMILDSSLEEEKIKKTLIIQKEIHSDLVALEDLMMMMISLVVV